SWLLYHGHIIFARQVVRKPPHHAFQSDCPSENSYGGFFHCDTRNSTLDDPWSGTAIRGLTFTAVGQDGFWALNLLFRPTICNSRTPNSASSTKALASNRAKRKCMRAAVVGTCRSHASCTRSHGSLCGPLYKKTKWVDTSWKLLLRREKPARCRRS